MPGYLGLDLPAKAGRALFLYLLSVVLSGVRGFAPLALVPVVLCGKLVELRNRFLLSAYFAFRIHQTSTFLLLVKNSRSTYQRVFSVS